MKSNITLSIVVPTYNRASFLETTINCFVDQIIANKLENEIELIISNNGSNDDTRLFINKAKTQHSFIQGFNQSHNLGVSKNIEFLLDKATGEYIWICGDDDLLRDGAITQILKCIGEQQPNFILINTTNIISLDNANRNLKVVLENRLNISKDIFIENFQRDSELLKPARNWLYLTNFIGADIFKKKLFESSIIGARQYVRPENTFAFQGPIIVGISNYGKLFVISKCLILHRKTEPSWMDDNSNAIFFMDLFFSTEISKLVKKYMPSEYKQYKKLFANFIMDEFMLETNRGMQTMKIRKFAWIAFYKHLDCFPENIKFLSMVAAPKSVTYVIPKLKIVIARLRNLL